MPAFSVSLATSLASLQPPPYPNAQAHNQGVPDPVAGNDAPRPDIDTGAMHAAAKHVDWDGDDETRPEEPIEIAGVVQLRRAEQSVRYSAAKNECGYEHYGCAAPSLHSYDMLKRFRAKVVRRAC